MTNEEVDEKVSKFTPELAEKVKYLVGFCKNRFGSPRDIYEEENYVKVEYFSSTRNILYFKVYEKYLEFCNLQEISFRYLDDVISNYNEIDRLTLVKDLESDKEYYKEEREELRKKWLKLHEYLNKIIGRNCYIDIDDDYGECIADDDLLIEKVNEYLKEKIND